MQMSQPSLPRRQPSQITQAPGPWPAQRRRAQQRARALVAALLPLGMALGGCNARLNEELIRQGHQAMVECQHGERAVTGGDELRCEDWAYVRSNYLEASRSRPE